MSTTMLYQKENRTTTRRTVEQNIDIKQYMKERQSTDIKRHDGCSYVTSIRNIEINICSDELLVNESVNFKELERKEMYNRINKLLGGR